MFHQRIFTASLLAGVLFSGAAFAEDKMSPANDAMGKPQAAPSTHDSMSKDGMGKGGMSKDGMAPSHGDMGKHDTMGMDKK